MEDNKEYVCIIRIDDFKSELREIYVTKPMSKLLACQYKQFYDMAKEKWNGYQYATVLEYKDAAGLFKEAKTLEITMGVE